MTLAVKWSELGVKDGSSPTYSTSWKGNGTCRRYFRVKWSDRHLAVKQLVGYSTAQTTSGVKRLRRELPEGYQGDSTMICTNASIVRGEKWTGRDAIDRTTYTSVSGYPKKDPNSDPDGDDLWKINQFSWAVIEATFTQIDFGIQTDATIDGTYAGNEMYRFVTYRDDRSASYITLREGKLYYVTGVSAVDGRLVDFAIGKIEAKKSIYLKWHQVALDAIPMNTIDAMIGKTNKYSFIGYDAGTLLFLPPKIDRYVMANGNFGCDVEYVLDYFDQGQNKLLKVSSSNEFEYYMVTTDPTLTSATPGSLAAKKFIYSEDDYSKVFVVNNG